MKQYIKYICRHPYYVSDSEFIPMIKSGPRALFVRVMHQVHVFIIL